MDLCVPKNNLVDHRSVHIHVVFLAFFFCTTSAGSDFFERGGVAADPATATTLFFNLCDPSS
jgi:hypothetical protein